VNVVRYADRPDLLERRYEELTKPTFPEYMNSNEPGGRYWGRLYTAFPDFQVALVDGEELLAEAHAIPLAWDGTLDDLPSGWGGFRARHDLEPAANGAHGDCDQRRARASGTTTLEPDDQTFTDNARAAGLSSVSAPVRPTWKRRFPLLPIERYIEWRRDDGSHFDPWIRIHERVGGEILAPAPESMTIRLPAVEWEALTGMRFPDDGEYVLPGGLATLSMHDGIGTHIEPNVWVLHRVRS